MLSWKDPKHPTAGGAEQVMHEHAKGWIKAGHKVTLFSSRFDGSNRQETLDGIRIIRVGRQYFGGVQLSGFFYYLKHKEEYDFVVDQFHGLPFFTPIYIRKPKLAVIQETAREVWFLNPFPRPFNWLIGIIGYVGEPLIFLLYHWTPFMTGSASAKKDVSKFGVPTENITVVPHGVILPKHQISSTKSQATTIIFLGALAKDKGVEEAIECFSLLSKENGPWQFWIVGKAETESYENRLRNMVSGNGIKENTKFWGFVSQDKKFELLARSHVLINPSVREGWGLVNIEANSAGTPVVAYKVAGLVDSVKDGQSGILCNQNNPEELAKEILDIINDEAKYAKLQKGALSWSKNFSWEKSRKLSLDLIIRIAGD